MFRCFGLWLTAGLLFATGFLLAGPGDSSTPPMIDFTKPVESVELFQEDTRPAVKAEPSVLPDQQTPAETNRGSEVLASSVVDSLEKLEKAQQLLEMADLLASVGDLETARKGYEEVQQLCPGSRFDGVATEKLHAMDAQKLVSADESQTGLSMTGAICWNCLTLVEPAIQVKWLDEAFLAYSRAIDEKKPKDVAMYHQVIRHLSPETAKNLEKLKPRELSATVRWKFVTMTYTKQVDGKQSLGFGLGFSGK